MDCTKCCGTTEIKDNGFVYCSGCGVLINRMMDLSVTSFNQSSHYMPEGYSRRTRFVKKILGALMLTASHIIDEKLMEYLKKRKIDTPEELLSTIAKFPSRGRRPYQFAMFYWYALGKPVPRCTDDDVRMLTFEFDNIQTAWNRLNIKKPCFPYVFILEKLVQAPKYSKGVKAFVPFLRKLRCPKRRVRYEQLFQKCRQLDLENLDYRQLSLTYDKMEEKVDTNETKSIITREMCRGDTMSPYDAKGVYKTQQEVDRAVRNGTFDVAKTMFVDKNNNIFFLAYEVNDMEGKKQKSMDMQKLSLQDAQQVKLDQTQKLDEMLRQQAAL